MNPYRMAPPPRWWAPKLSPALVRLARPFRRRRRVREQRLVEVQVRGAKKVADCVAAGKGVLITPNHSTHADPFTMYEAADQVGTPFYFMATKGGQPAPLSFLVLLATTLDRPAVVFVFGR